MGLQKLGSSLYNNAYLASRRSQYLSSIVPTTITSDAAPVLSQALSALEMKRIENIQRNQNFLAAIGLADAKPIVKASSTSAVQKSVKIPENEIPTDKELALLGKTFTDDEDRTKSYSVVEVKFSPEHDGVCCFCIPYSDAAKRDDDDDLVYDCVYVGNNCDDGSCGDDDNDDGGDGGDDDGGDDDGSDDDND